MDNSNNLPKKIPVFPLSNFIVFPETTVPLNIFEPRYLKMTEDAMASDRLIGMIQPKRTGDMKKPDLFNVGFPIAEFHENGDFFITKPKNTGGLVNKATITEQLLYETHNPNQYIVPDVVADMSELNLIEEEPNKVLVKGAVGHKKPDLLKATICSESGFMGEAEMSYAGPNALQRARLALEVIEKRIQKIGFLVIINS